jgi:uncharacterized protein with NRDE domain
MSKRGSKNAIKFAGKSWSVGKIKRKKLKANKKNKLSKVKRSTNSLSNLVADKIWAKLKKLVKQ